MLFHIEGNSKWASKFNRVMMKCHEKMETNERSNFENMIQLDLVGQMSEEEEQKEEVTLES